MQRLRSYSLKPETLLSVKRRVAQSVGCGYTFVRAVYCSLLHRDKAMARRIILTFLATTLLVGCGFTWKTPRPGLSDTGSRPEVLAFYADRVIRPGDTWRVYLKVKDVDCDMTYVITDMQRSGVSAYPVSFTPIRETACPDLVGYVFLRTPVDRNLVWERFEAKISVRDGRGNQSKSIRLPLNFDQASSTKPPEQWQAPTVVSIGALQIDLLDSRETDLGR